MKQVFKRLCSVLLALALIVSVFPAITPHTHAAGTLSVTDTNIGLSWSGSSNFWGALYLGLPAVIILPVQLKVIGRCSRIRLCRRP